MVPFFIILVLLSKQVNANDTEQINEEFNYYNVTNWVDYDRKQRLEACERVYKANKEFVDNTYIHTNQDVVIRCATMM